MEINIRENPNKGRSRMDNPESFTQEDRKCKNKTED
jgi:hypothetical protein